MRLVKITQHGADLTINDTTAPAAVIPNSDTPPIPIHPNNPIDPPPGGAIIHHLTTPHDDQRNPADAPPPISWLVTELSPHFQTPTHTTHTHDYGIVLHGEVDLLLETKTITLHIGDAITITNAPHAWRTSKQGATIATVVYPLRDRSR
ncbi:hypothetical protein [Mycobacterium vicinigordonae]|uniref:Cupin 2 conserved barrel domain-containing protein n=1 Tax=Mycobacterium vicinigordonae TaxID=1719132 RepID=A0A7D6E2R4_9MYCO|nr:hypothetical protein [Mycobacterium vicinigordonae]QLL07486.1 hypothetical protein H0P51_00135 [Mycobacterium vicinigordonae]